MLSNKGKPKPVPKQIIFSQIIYSADLILSNSLLLFLGRLKQALNGSMYHPYINGELFQQF